MARFLFTGSSDFIGINIIDREKNIMPKRRLASVDFAKGIAIMAVVAGHIIYTVSLAGLFSCRDFIYLWHIPVFFLIAGFFVKDDSLCNPKKYIGHKVSTVYVKLLKYYIPAVLLHNVMVEVGWYDGGAGYPPISLYSLPEMVKNIVLTIFLAGREPIVGAMWFVFVLLEAFIGLSLLMWVMKKIVTEERKRLVVTMTLLLLGTVMFGILSNHYEFTIQRCSNVPTAMLLIYVGKYIYQNLRPSFSNGWIFLASVLIVIEQATMLGGVHLNSNKFADISQLLLSAPSILYVIMYIGKKTEKSLVSRGVAYLGRYSFEIMALHLASFKICTYTLNALRIAKIPVVGGVITDLTPQLNSMVMWAVYMFFGLTIPLLFVLVKDKVYYAIRFKKR